MIFVVISVHTLFASTEKYWEKFDQAISDGLPRTAIPYLDRIIEIAKKEHNYGEWMTALTEKILLEATIQGNKPEEKIKRLQQELISADKESKFLLQAVLAHWYWHYFKRNKYRFMNRTQTIDLREEDFTTWDLRKLFGVIDSLYQDLLEHQVVLGTLPVDKYLDFLEPGNTPVDYRPTLLDFIAHEALHFYTCAEQVAARPEDAFEIDAQSDAFGPTNAFILYTPDTKDTASSMYKAVKIYQTLLAFHLENNNYDALIDLEIHRLNYIKNVSFGDNKNEIFIQRLTELYDQYVDTELFSLIAFCLARAWKGKLEYVKAYEIAEQGYKKLPESFGGTACKALMEELVEKSVKIDCEQCIPPQPSTMNITYKNFTTVYFRIYPDNWDRFMKQKNRRPNEIDTLVLKELITQTPYKEWKKELPATPDLKYNVIETDLPELQPGYYRIIASWEEDFSKSSMLTHTWFWVSSMTIVQRSGNEIIDGFVLDAITGEPIESVNVTQIVGRKGQYEFGDSTYTDLNGYFSFDCPHQRNYYHWYEGRYLYIQKGSEELFNSQSIHSYRSYKTKSQTKTFLFTDRSLYRPGQTLYFKGICVFMDHEEKDYRIMPNQDVVVQFFDKNYQQITTASFMTNDFGSFSGHFTIPADRLTGRYNIQVRNPQGRVDFHVEEYKRPKFTVEIDAPEKASKLNDNVEVTGKAIAYTGAPINNALVTYRVQRNTSFPYWWSWYYPYRWSRYSAKTQLITHGTIHTNEQGNFTISFFAKPDLNYSPDDDPRFSFTIHADVTSPDGETISADRRIVLGYSAMEIKLATTDQMQENTKFSIQVTTQTFDGVDLPASAQIYIYKLQEPPRPIPEKLWKHQPLGIQRKLDESEEEPFTDDWRKWPKDKKVYEAGLTTQYENPESVSIALPTGFYRAECYAYDGYGKKVKALLPFMVIPDWDKKHFSLKLPFIVSTKSNTVQVWDNFELLWGTGYETGRCFVEIEHDHKIIKQYWTEKGHTQHVLQFRVTEKFRGGFVVYLTQVRENRAYLERINVSVPWDNKDLIITKETFRDKLQPGSKEKIKLKIKGKKKFIAAAELLAAMYDYSLDQFYKHTWPGFSFFKIYRSHRYSSFINRAHSFSYWRFPNQRTTVYLPKRTFIRFPNYIVKDFFYYRFPSKAMVTYSKHKEFKGNYGKIQGRILDAETGEALIGADAFIEGTELGAATDENGEFVILNVPEGTWTITAAYISYNPYTYTGVKAIKGHTTTLDFRLQPTVIQMEAITCVAERPEIVVSETSTGRAVSTPPLDRLPVTTVNQVISLQGGVEVFSAAELKNIKIRKDFSETAFFYPHLYLERDGTISFEFTSSEVLTKWKFMGFAHGKECESGAITEFAVTQKDLMVQSNPPRFLRERDTLFFTAKVVNMSDRTQIGRVQLDFKDLITEKSVNEALGLNPNVCAFNIDAHSSETFAWKLYIPKGTNPLQFTVVAKSKHLSDGESDALPVLSSRIFITETQPLHVRGGQSRQFTFNRLKEIETSITLDPYCFTLQMVSNPSWYAIQALPYLSEYPYGCSEQVFNRYYANSLASYIVNSDPRIEEVFEQWRGTDALLSNLEKNEQLKSVSLRETPWVKQAHHETEAKQKIGMLFEKNTLQNDLKNTLKKLEKLQLNDGSWPWFPGGLSSHYITLYITTGFGRLRHLGVPVDISLALRSLEYLDNWIRFMYEHKNMYPLSHQIALYLYGRSFFLKDRSFSPKTKEAVNYYLKQAENHWLDLNSRMSQAYIALVLHRFEKSKTAHKIIGSIKERSVHDEELGMFWREDERSWWWYRAPIETQALMIEAFDEIANDSVSVEECKIWLLKQKQTQHWHTTKATADVVYALVLRGVDWLASTELVEVKLGETTITPEKIEAGTNFYEKVYMGGDILPEFSDIMVSKQEAGIAWGGAFFQYFEEIENVTPHTTNLQIDKKIFVNRETKQGRFIEPLKGTLKVGDLITVRIILRVDRDMEFVHLKDLRGCGLEPVDVLSRYRYQDGLRYYQSTKDAATHFFIDYLPKGTYVFEYDLRVQHRGKYQSGIAEIQCMYAPEFSSHSQSQWLKVE